MTESSHMVEIWGSFDPVLIPFSSFSPFSILGGPDIRIWKTIKMKPVEEIDRKGGGYFGRVLETGSKPACEFCSYSQESALAAAVFWFPDLVPRLRRKCENKWMRRCDRIPPKSGK